MGFSGERGWRGLEGHEGVWCFPTFGAEPILTVGSSGDGSDTSRPGFIASQCHLPTALLHAAPKGFLDSFH